MGVSRRLQYTISDRHIHRDGGSSALATLAWAVRAPSYIPFLCYEVVVASVCFVSFVGPGYCNRDPSGGTCCVLTCTGCRRMSRVRHGSLLAPPMMIMWGAQPTHQEQYLVQAGAGINPC